jgi:flagellar protein FlbD
MIFLTKMDGKQFVVNDDLILYAESTPDTVLVLTTGARLMVREPLSVVVERAAQYRRSLQLGFADAVDAESDNSTTEFGGD